MTIAIAIIAGSLSWVLLSYLGNLVILATRPTQYTPEILRTQVVVIAFLTALLVWTLQ